MGKLNISNRYAKAFIETANEKKVIEKVTEDMQLIQNVLENSRELRTFLSNPIMNDAKKIEVLSAIFSDKLCDVSLSFLKFIVEKKRINMLIDISRRFNDIRDESLRISNAEVITATQIDDTQKEMLKTNLESFTKKKLRMKFKTDDSIIGGFKVRILDQIIDATLKNQLNKLKKKLLEESISVN
ncbi:MAG: ATP synthase F1 subunit delta [Bacteroidetes bacterium]|nr:ATP synthase F1 subunit delta [Bacteroidota bacterium]